MKPVSELKDFFINLKGNFPALEFSITINNDDIVVLRITKVIELFLEKESLNKELSEIYESAKKYIKESYEPRD